MKKRLRWIMIALMLAGIAYVVIVALLTINQDALIFPGSRGKHDPLTEVPTHPGCEIVSLRGGQGEKLKGIFGPALSPDGRISPDSAGRPTFLYFYGNGGTIQRNSNTFEYFRRRGVNVMLIDYPGYGMSEGYPTEQSLQAASRAALNHLLARPDVDPSKIIYVGLSLGGAIAIDLVTERNPFGLLLFCSFTSLPDVVSSRYPFLPAKLLLKNEFPSVRKIGQANCPILLIHGTADRTVPSWMSDNLAAAAKAPTTVKKREGANHNQLVVDGPELNDDIQGFLEACLKQAPVTQP